MDEIQKLVLEILKQILPYFVSIVTAISSYICFRIYAKKQSEKEKALKEQLEQARSRETYIKCPKCGSKLPLSQVNFYLPGDVVDNDLNGKPDLMEKE